MKGVLRGLALLALGGALATSAGCKCGPGNGTDTGITTDGGMSSCGDGTCDTDETCNNCAQDCGACPTGAGCEPLQPGDPIVPGGIGSCCDQADTGSATAECVAPLGCLNGYCTALACGDDSDCSGEVGPGDRSPFPVGTTFGCVTAVPNLAPFSYCAPLGSGRRECGGPSGVACAPTGETCVLAWDPDETFGGLCMTSITQPDSIGGAASLGDACFLSSVRPCTSDGDCRSVAGTAIETCDVLDGTCKLKSPYNKYQCPGMEGSGEFIRPSVGFNVTSNFTGPGGVYGWEGGCFSGPFGGPSDCVAFCDPNNPDCPTGMNCARWDTFSDGNIGLCVQQECRYDFGPVANGTTGVNPINPPSCTIDADCAGYAGGAFGSRCLDTDANGIADTCENVDRVTACPAGTFCGHAVWSNKVDQGIDPASMTLTELDTFEMYCVPELVGDALGGLGDPCVDSLDCLSGLCSRGEIFDPTTPGSPVAVTGTCSEVCINDASCAMASDGPEVCVAFGVFGNGATSTWPVCLPADVDFMVSYCLGESDCAAGESCGFFTFRTGIGACNTRTGALSPTSPTGGAVTDNLLNGAVCFNDINRCDTGDDNVMDSTPADAELGTCVGDDVLIPNSNNCASGLCLDGDDLSGGTVDGPAVCSTVCNDNSDCAGPQVCQGVLLNNNSTDDGTDDTALGLCLTFAPVANPCNDNGTSVLNDADCTTTFPLPMVSAGTVLGCDDTTPVPATYAETFPGEGVAGERDSGACYNTIGTIGAPCIIDQDCNIGGRCILDDGSGMTVNNFSGGYCVQDGCAFDPAMGVGALNPIDCPTGFDPGNGNTDVVCANTGAAGLCFKACTADADCRMGGTAYTCQPAIMGMTQMVCVPPTM